MNLKLVRPLLLCLVTAVLAFGCAEERPPINRVQANALDKAFFVGEKLMDPVDDPEFWTQATIIDVGYGAPGFGLFTSTFTQGVARIKWEVTEDVLLGRLTYERIENSDGKGAGAASTDGQVVAAYKILKHFDIRHAYNPSTGEEQNVIEENTSDRPWYERQYMRVDWSRNENTNAYDFDTLSLLGIYGGIEYSPLAYYVNDPSHEDAPHFDVQSGYFDVTNKVFAAPGLIDLSHLGWGIDKIPACWLESDLFGGSYPAGNCNPTEVTIRQSFRRVVDTDFEPSDWDGYRFQAYGGFYVERYGYARNFGMTDQQWHRFLTRYNIWQRSHYYDDSTGMKGAVTCFSPEVDETRFEVPFQHGDDPHADKNKDGTEDACRAVTVNLGKKSGICSEAVLGTHELCQGGIDDTKCFDRGFDKDNDKSLSDAERSTCKAELEFQCCYDLAQPVHGGSRCDTFKQRCTLPYRHRKVRPLAWYFTNGSNQFFFNSTEWATHDHDVAMRHAIMVARYSECMATAKDRDWCLNGNVDGEGNSVAGDNLDGEPITTVDGQPRAKGNPVYFGQMDDHLEAQQLAKEVDDCRHGLSYVGINQEDYGPINSAEREQKCVELAATVAAARGGDSRPLDPGVVKLAAMPEQIALCHSPVEADDPAICGAAEERLPAGLTAQDCALARAEHDTETLDTCKRAINVRRGDLRYHLVNVLEAPQSNSPWGIYTDAEDPLTGETFSAGINVWSHVNDLFSQQMVERARYIKGELALEQVTEGTYVKNWAQAAEAASGNGTAPKMSRHQLNRRLADFVGMEVDQFEDLQLAGDLKQKMRKQREEIREVRAAADAPSTMGAIYDARRKAIIGTEIEAELADPMMQDLAGVTGMPSEVATERASIARGLNPVAQKQLRNMFEQSLAARGTCMYHEAPVPMAMTSMADALEQKFQHVCARRDDAGNCTTYYGPLGTSGLTNCSDPNDPSSCVANTDADIAFQEERAELMRRYVAERANYGVIVHEMGHSVGERHNFVSSSDAFSYRPQYWQLRTNDGTNDTLCEDYSEDGSCVGPRWFDPLTKNERDNMIWLWMHSSVMDYAGEYTQDFLGLGGYDVAAVRMFYGENVAMFADPSYRVSEERAGGVLAKTDNFGGIIGIPVEYNGEDIHYSALQNHYEMITDCAEVNPQTYRPASWDDDIHGIWHPVLDGLIVKNGSGKFTKCKQQKVDYRPWQTLRFPSNTELTNGGQTPEFWRGGPAVDTDKRLRVPYGFATDRWADLGNASVYRHDNGADVYEIFDFLSTQQEVQHIFDNYRRNRQSFSVRGASARTLVRYNEKIRDGAKGLGLLANWYRDNWSSSGAAFTALWGAAVKSFFPHNVLASGMVFDAFARQMQRPEVGPHYEDRYQAFDGNGILRSSEDSTTLYATENIITIPNGAAGFEFDGYSDVNAFGVVGFGGKLVENRLCENCGEFDSEYTVNAGSYYDKVYAPYLMTESVDNFISDSRGDFVDGRYRAVSLADLYPDGYRRWLGNSLTGDDFLKGPRLAADTTGQILTDVDEYPSWPIGWITWWSDEPRACFPAPGTTICETFGGDSALFDPRTPDGTRVVDPQIGYEQHKFLIAETFLYLPENHKQTWLEMLRVWQLGLDADPGLSQRIEFHDPVGRVWIAKAFGRETIFGKLVHKGIAARMLEWANELLAKAYVVTPVDYDNDGDVDWYEPEYDQNGEPMVQFDPQMLWLNPDGEGFGSPPPNCSALDNSGCTCADNQHCTNLKRYMNTLQFLWQSINYFSYAFPELKGIYN